MRADSFFGDRLSAIQGEIESVFLCYLNESRFLCYLLASNCKLIKLVLISHSVIVAGLYFISILDKKLFLAFKELRKEIEQINNSETR